MAPVGCGPISRGRPGGGGPPGGGRPPVRRAGRRPAGCPRRGDGGRGARRRHSGRRGPGADRRRHLGDPLPGTFGGRHPRGPAARRGAFGRGSGPDRGAGAAGWPSRSSTPIARPTISSRPTRWPSGIAGIPVRRARPGPGHPTYYGARRVRRPFRPGRRGPAPSARRIGTEPTTVPARRCHSWPSYYRSREASLPPLRSLPAGATSIGGRDDCPLGNRAGLGSNGRSRPIDVRPRRSSRDGFPRNVPPTR